MSWLTYLPLYLLVAVVGNIKKKGEVWAAYEITGTQEQSHATNYRRIRHEHAHRGTVASVHAFLDMYTRAHGCSPYYLPNRFVLFKVFVCTFATSKKVAMLGSKGRSAAIKRIMSPVYTVRKGATKVWKWFKVYLMVAKKRWGTVRKSDSLTSFYFFQCFSDFSYFGDVAALMTRVRCNWRRCACMSSAPWPIAVPAAKRRSTFFMRVSHEIERNFDVTKSDKRESSKLFQNLTF